MGASIHGIIDYGFRGLVVDVECSLSNNLPNIVIVGYANKAVSEARERIRGAFMASGLHLPRKRITINLAPADIPKADSGFDLAIAVSILQADKDTPVRVIDNCAFIGELGLDGSVRAVRGIIGKLLTGREHGINQFYIPAANLSQAMAVPNTTVTAVHSLAEVVGHLTGAATLESVRTGGALAEGPPALLPADVPRFSDVVGQLQAKRALIIAAAGGHNVLLHGPPGTGKSMLAKAMPSILPPLTPDEILEVTHLHSLASLNYDRLITARPFRSPHHSASLPAITGGGAQLKPGEISLAHRGVLFFDELPEFNRLTLEALRQPLEDRVISVARARYAADYPANFILVATANPCPCGYHNTAAGECRCQASDLLRYEQRLSGPILDRIDLSTSVHEVAHASLLTTALSEQNDEAIRHQVAQARALQAKRFKNSANLNAHMTNHEIKLCARLAPEARDILDTGAKAYRLSARAYMRTIKVARTIADLENSKTIGLEHLAEALTYRHQ